MKGKFHAEYWKMTGEENLGEKCMEMVLEYRQKNEEESIIVEMTCVMQKVKETKNLQMKGKLHTEHLIVLRKEKKKEKLRKGDLEIELENKGK